MGNFAQSLFGLARRYAAGEQPSGGGGMFGGMAYRMSQDPAFRGGVGQTPPTNQMPPTNQVPTHQPPIPQQTQFGMAQGSAQGLGFPMGRQPYTRDPYGYMPPEMGRLLRMVGMGSRFTGFNR